MCEIIGDGNYSKEMMMLRLATNGYKDLILHVVPFDKDFVIQANVYTVGENMAINLPKDFVFYNRVAVCREGRLYDLGIDKDICAKTVTNDDNCPVPTPAPVTPSSSTTSDLPFFNFTGSGYTERYAVRGGYNTIGYYWLDRENNRLLLSDVAPGTEIIVSYKADIGNGKNEVLTECEEAIKAYMLKNLSLNPRMNLARKDYQRLYESEYKRLNKFYQTLTATEYYDLIMREVYSGAKR